MHGWKLLENGFFTTMRNIEEGSTVGRASSCLDFGVDCFSDNVSSQQLRWSADGCEFARNHFFNPLIAFFDSISVVTSKHLRDIIEHESLAFGVGEPSAFASNTFGHENASNRWWPNHSSRVELNKFHVAQFCASPEGEGVTVTCVFP